MSLDKAFSSRTLARQFYDEWVNEIKRHVAPDRLLRYDVKSGWKPLCEFLELPIPPDDTPFPRANDTKEIQSGILKFQVVSWTILVIPIVAGLAVVATILPSHLVM